MKIQCLQHVPFEGPAHLAIIARDRGLTLERTRVFDGEELPGTDDFDLLAVMGGPMGANDEAAYPWLAAEKKLIERSIREGKLILGICLGAQLIADVLGAGSAGTATGRLAGFRCDGGQRPGPARPAGRSRRAFTPSTGTATRSIYPPEGSALRKAMPAGTRDSCGRTVSPRSSSTLRPRRIVYVPFSATAGMSWTVPSSCRAGRLSSISGMYMTAIACLKRSWINWRFRDSYRWARGSEHPNGDSYRQ